jgi:DNA-binding NarL/FixJ family response regulator
VNTTVLLVEDFPLVREGLAAALRHDPAIDVVGLAADAREGLDLARQLKPDVVVLDLGLPEGGGIALLERLREDLPDAGKLVVTASEKAETLLDAVAAGANGYLTKRTTRDEPIQAVITVHGGGSVITPTLAGHLLRDYAHAQRGEPSRVRPLLTSREHELLRLVAQGHTDRQIASMLYISPRTVQNHLTRIREKTGAAAAPRAGALGDKSHGRLSKPTDGPCKTPRTSSSSFVPASTTRRCRRSS